jgi:hypothetical protein
MVETVTPQREFGSQSGMGAVGWVIAGLIGLLFLPVLPFLLVVYVALKLAGSGNPPE